MTATTKSLSSSQMAKRYSISRPTAWLFVHKVRSAMQSSELNPVIGTVYVDEFVYGGKEDLKQGRSNNTKKKKIVAALELDEYSYRLNRSIHKQTIFDNLIRRVVNQKHIDLQRIKIST